MSTGLRFNLFQYFINFIIEFCHFFSQVYLLLDIIYLFVAPATRIPFLISIADNVVLAHSYLTDFYMLILHPENL